MTFCTWSPIWRPPVGGWSGWSWPNGRRGTPRRSGPPWSPRTMPFWRPPIWWGGRLLLQRLRDAASQVRIHGLDGEEEGALELPGPGTVAGISGRPDQSMFYYAFTSFLHPTTVLRYDLETGLGGVFRAPAFDFDPTPFVTEQHFALSKDGTRVPFFMTRRRDAPRNGGGRVLLTGYGGFGVSLTPSHSVSNTLWLEEGGILVVANLRGGGEYGDEWHRAGTGAGKQRVFDDFIAVAERLVEEGWTTPSRLAIRGGSNGGLLVGAVVNQRPELFGGVPPGGGGDGHAPLPPLHHRVGLGLRLRLVRGPGDVPPPPGLFPTPQPPYRELPSRHPGDHRRP